MPDELKRRRKIKAANLFLEALTRYPFIAVFLDGDDVRVYVKQIDEETLPPKMQAFLASLEEFAG